MRPRCILSAHSKGSDWSLKGQKKKSRGTKRKARGHTRSILFGYYLNSFFSNGLKIISKAKIDTFFILSISLSFLLYLSSTFISPSNSLTPCLPLSITHSRVFKHLTYCLLLFRYSTCNIVYMNSMIVFEIA